MSVKILHASDFHLDSPFDSLPEEKAAERRREGRALLDKIAQLVTDEKIELVLLAGDLLDSAVSYYETQEALRQMLSRMRAEIFIAPGNHDYYSAKSPYFTLELPENVHIFTSPAVKCFELPKLGCCVWGAGFNAPQCPPLLRGFSVPASDAIELMVLHGDLSGEQYNHVSDADIAGSKLDYLALGHVHTFSGFQKAGFTTYAYSGCPEGRGFDETGAKGVIIGEVSKTGSNLRFVPLGGREYRILEVDLTGKTDAADALAAVRSITAPRDVARIVLTGEFDGGLNTDALADSLRDNFYAVTVRDATRPRRDLWAEADDDTLKGLFLRRLRAQFVAADEPGKQKILLAARYGLAALENREELRL